MQSLLSPHSSLHAQIRTAGTAAHSAWPDGFVLERLAAEYLLGLAAGELDLSGRQTEPAQGTNPKQLQPEHSAAPVVIVDLEDFTPLARKLGLQVLATYADEVLSDSTPAVNTNGSAPAGGGTVEQPSADSLAALAARLNSTRATAVMKAPKAVAALRENLAALVSGCEKVVVVGKDKHVPRTIKAELARYFQRVDISPGVAKSRVYIATAPVPAPQRPHDVFPASALRESKLPQVPNLGVFAHGACFGGTSVDAGAWHLLAAVLENRERFAPWSVRQTAEAPRSSARLVDLGCGNGWLLAAAASALRPGSSVGTDISRAACASTQATLQAAGVDAQVTLSDAGADLESDSAELVLLNPPFHDSNAISVESAHRMIEAAYRIAKPGTWVVLVFNSHLRYRSHVNHLFGNSVQVRRNAKFTVIAAQKPGD